MNFTSEWSDCRLTDKKWGFFIQEKKSGFDCSPIKVLRELSLPDFKKGS